MQSHGGRIGREAAVFTVVVVLILAGTVFLWFPPVSLSNPQPTSTKTVTTTDTGITGVIGSENNTGGPAGLNSFQTFNELHQFITANAKATQQYQYQYGGIRFGGPVPAIQGGIAVTTSTVTMAGAQSTTTVAGGVTLTTTATTTVGGANAPANGDYTNTNNQVQGVDELDKVKTDGSYLYVATSQSVSILKAQGSSTSTVSSIRFPTEQVMGIDIAPQRLTVIAQSSTGASVSLRLYNVSIPSAPHLLNSVMVNGSHVAARVSQGYLYEIIQQPSYVVSGSGNVTAKVPTLVEGGVSAPLPPSSTYYTPNKSQINVYTMVVSMSMTTGLEHSIAVLTGPSSTVYVSTSNIYVVYSNYPLYSTHNIPGDVYGGGGPYGQPQNSTVFRVAYLKGDVAVKSAGSFPGAVLNQFSMDEYNGYFRVATSRVGTLNSGSSRIDDVYVFSQNFTQVAAILDIAPGENIYAVRFTGDTGYVVTFEQIDPLFSISFKDPTHPVITSALQVSGFSDYLHPFGNAYLIGVGKDAMPSPNGNFAWYLGVKLSLFHVGSDGSSSEVARYLIGDRGTDSAVINDHLAFTFDSATNVMVIPIHLAKIQGQQTTCSGCPPPYGQFVWQGVYVFSVSPSGFDLLGTVSQNPPGSQTYWGSSGNHVIDRSVIIGSTLYTISQDEVMASDMSSFSTLATVLLS